MTLLGHRQAIPQRVRQAPDQVGIAKRLHAAARNLTDARLAALSDDHRFDAADKTLMQCAMAARWAHGYRTATSQPGHHQTAIQTLPNTMGIPAPTVIVLDALRQQCNVNDDEGDPVSDAALASCLDEAAKLMAPTRHWLATEHPGLAESRLCNVNPSS
ncbi:DNA-binding protein [Crenobacter sp. SG2303]|uniref:DNA-binding protein n=1 Tax=Crenobacter oryzisoli TaxID=3056844 RepID=A0ABT7XMV5_9NEIS|nr:DNA-binding protein [Crenobacter sp. SG2303]MDN0075120.1 DNA-binding protein [Crenobacter sp. SG2303]